MSSTKKKNNYIYWLNIYPDGEMSFHKSRELANILSTMDRIACQKIEFTVDVDEDLLDEEFLKTLNDLNGAAEK